jgi:hypothetical protein
MIIAMQRLDKHLAIHTCNNRSYVSLADVIARCWGAASRPMSCLGDEDVIQDATIQEAMQVVFSASLLRTLGGYISRPTKLNSVSRRLEESESV